MLFRSGRALVREPRWLPPAGFFFARLLRVRLAGRQGRAGPPGSQLRFDPDISASLAAPKLVVLPVGFVLASVYNFELTTAKQTGVLEAIAAPRALLR